VDVLSRLDQIFARTRRYRELIFRGMPEKDAFKTAHINRATYDKYLPVLPEMPLYKVIERPVPAGWEKKNRLHR
jgi:hypothetical protein